MKLKQKLILAGSLIVTIPLVGYAALRVAGIINLMKTPTVACMPAIKANEYILGCRFKTPKVNDLVCFESFDESSGKDQMFVSRMVATGGDKVEMKDGVLYVNDKNADAGRTLYNAYIVPQKYTDEFNEQDVVTAGIPGVSGADAMVFATEATIRQHKVPAQRLIYKTDYQDEFMQKQWNKPWNADQFGPVTVPAGHYFVVSDNRHNAFDSRYRGSIPMDKHKYVVVW